MYVVFEIKIQVDILHATQVYRFDEKISYQSEVRAFGINSVVRTSGLGDNDGSIGALDNRAVTLGGHFTDGDGREASSRS